MAVLPQVVERHAGEAAILWRLREQQCSAPRATLAVLERFDRRLEAHLDGLRIAGESGEERAWAGAVPGRAESYFPAVWLALAGQREESSEKAVAAAGEDPAALRALEAALDWTPFEALWSRVEAWLGSREPLRRALGLRACQRHRRDPLWAIEPGLSDEEERVCSIAAWAAGDLGRVDLLAPLRDLRTEAEGEVGFAATRSCILLGERQAAVFAAKIALSGSEFALEAARLAARALPREGAQTLIRDLSCEATTSRCAVIAAGASGLPAMIPWLIERAEEPELARVAGAAVTLITGIDLAEAGLEEAPPAQLEAGPNDDPADPNVAMDADRGLPFPSASALGDWWLREQSRFEQGGRYLAGEPAEQAPVERMLAESAGPARRAAALEWKLRAPMEALFAWRAPALRQRAFLNHSVNHSPAAAGPLARAS